MNPDWVIRSDRVLTESGLEPATILVSDGRIASLEAGRAGSVPAGVRQVDVGDGVVMAGVVDAHVHINEPGRTAWEGFRSAGRAAVAGGVTTLVDMPLNSTPVTTTAAAVVAKTSCLPRSRADVGLWGGLVPANADRMVPLLDAGMLGVKCFLVASGIAEFPLVDAVALRQAMPVLAARGVPLLVHAELPGPIARAPRLARSHRYADWLATRPVAAEAEAVVMLVALAVATGCPVHVVHVSCAEAVRVLRAARARGVPITGETCPHYLSFCAEEIPDGEVAFKCAPPIRGRSEQDALWHALADGTLDYVASDHSPCVPALKSAALNGVTGGGSEARAMQGDLMAAWGGIASLQLLLPALWTGMRRRGLPLERLLAWLCRAPAERAGLGAIKGRIAPGYDADLVIWHPHRSFVVRGAELHHRHPLTPYAGAVLDGVVERTFVRGKLVFDRGRFPGHAAGRWLARRERAWPRAAAGCRLESGRVSWHDRRMSRSSQ